MPTERERIAKLDIDYYTQQARHYDHEVTREYDIYHEYSLYPFLDEMRQRYVGAKVLDLACGTGAVTLALAARGFQVTAIDHTPEMLEVAKQKAEELGLARRVDFSIGDVTSLDYRDGQFDGVTCQRAMHHFVDLEAPISELHRVLRPGGFFYIADACAERTPVRTALKTARRWLRALGISERPRPAVSLPEQDFTKPPQDYLRCLERFGLEYRVEYLTHIGLSRHLSDRARLFLARILSFPWRKTKGDMIFIYGNRP